MGTQVDANELLTWLESTDLGLVQQVEMLIKENLTNSREAWLLNGLVDSYVVSHSSHCMEILAAVQEPHDKHLFDKLLEHLKGSSNRLQSLTLLGHIIRKQPPWLHKIARHQLLSAVIKCLKTDADVPVLMTGVLIITSLLPVIPVAIAPLLGDILEVFSRLAAFNQRKPAGHVPDVYLLHLQVGVYSLFHRLYGMYPCNLLTYLRAVYSKPDNQQVFEQTIKPMLERVRMHPLLVTASKDKELSTERWRRKEIHDIMVDCAKFSLDMIEGSSEEMLCPIVGARTSRSRFKDALQPKQLTAEPVASLTSSTMMSQVPSLAQPVSIPPMPSAGALASYDPASIWSPSTMCGLSTPPPVAMATSSTEFSATSASQQGTNTNSPLRTTPHLPLESPVPLDHSQMAAQDKPCYVITSSAAPSVTNTPVSAQPTPQKRLSVISMSLAGNLVTPTLEGWGWPGDLSVPPSPLKPEFTSEPPIHAQRMQAIRKISFDSAPPDGTTTEEALDVLEEVPLAIKRREFKMTGESPGGPLTSIDSGGTPVSHLESKQLELDSTNPLARQEIPAASDPQPIISGTPAGGSSEGATTPSVSQLSQLLDSLDVSQERLDKSEEIDQEVSALTQDVDGSSSSESDGEVPSHLPSDVELTAESVAAFMKKVNRIRFNTINVVRDRGAKRKTTSRPSSCPDFETMDEEEGAGEEKDEEITEKDEMLISSSVPTHMLPMMSKPTSEVDPPPPITTTTVTEVTRVTTVTQHTAVTSGEQQVEAQNGGASNLQEVTMFSPYEHLFPLTLPHAPLLLCYNCQTQAKDSAARREGPPPDIIKHPLQGKEPPYYTTFSPPDLLDRHIELGSDVHAKELSQIPLTSQGNISWTHFGGVPPTDEVNILRGQIQLLHNQLMFERHKRELHAKRNRRLLGRIVKHTALEEQNAAMQDSLRLQEGEIQKLSLSLRLQQNEIAELRQAKDTHVCDKQLQQRAFLQDIETMKSSNKDLQSQLETSRGDKVKLEKELQSTKSLMFEMENELGSLRARAATVTDLRDQVSRLNKELLLMGELQQKYQQRLVAVSNSHNPKPEMQFIMDTYKAEMAAKSLCLDQKTVQLDATKAKLVESEEQCKQKDVVLSEQKKMLEEVKIAHKGEIQSVEEKYRAEKKIVQALYAQVLELHNDLSQLQKPHPPPGEGGIRQDLQSQVLEDGGAVSIDTQTSPSLGFTGGSTLEAYCRQVASDGNISEGSIATESAYSAHEDSVITPVSLSTTTSNHTDVGQSD